MCSNKLFSLILILSFAAPAQAGWFAEKRERKQMLADAQTAFEQQNYKAAVEITQEFLLKNTGRRGAQKAYLLLGETYKAMGQYDKAMLKYTEASEFYPQDTDITLALADIYFFGGLTDRAIEIYKKVLQLQANNEPAKLGLARSYLSEGFFDRATKYFDEYIKDTKTKDAGVFYDAALNSFYANDYTAALQLAKQAQEIKPSSSITFLLAKIHKAFGDNKLALATIEEALRQNPQDQEIFLTRALWLAFDKQTAQQAVTAADEYLAAHPSDRLALFVKFMALDQLGQKELAAQNIKAITKIEGDGFINKISSSISKNYK